jgi:hypothetical protein
MSDAQIALELATGEGVPLLDYPNNGVASEIASAGGNTTVVTVPARARAVLLFFEAGGIGVRGRYAFDDSATPVATTATNLGYHPSSPSIHRVPHNRRYLHLAATTATTTSYVTFLY